VAGPNLLGRLLGIPVGDDAVCDLRSGSGTSGVGTMAISISVGVIAEGGKPFRTSSEGPVIDEDSCIDT